MSATSTKHRLLVLGNGSSIHTQKWIEGLAFTGEWDIELITMNPTPPLAGLTRIPALQHIQQIAPTQVNERGNNYQYLYNLQRLRRHIQSFDPAVISTLYLSSYGIIGALLKGRAKLVQFVLGTDVMVFPDQSWIKRAAARFALRRSDFVVSASRTMTAKLAGELGVARSHILTQQYGVNEWLLELPARNRKYDFVSNRAWIPNSNVDYFLEILRRMPEQPTAAVVGAPMAGSETLAAKIAQLADGDSTALDGAKALGKIELILPLPHEENIRLVAGARFLVSLTNSDGASLSVMEAMAVGTIPVVSDIAPNREWITHGKNGFLIPLRDADEAGRRFQQAVNLSAEDQSQFVARNKAIIFERGLLTRNTGRVSRRMKELLE